VETEERGDGLDPHITVPEVRDAKPKPIHIPPAVTIAPENGRIATRVAGTTGIMIASEVTVVIVVTEAIADAETTMRGHLVVREIEICSMSDPDARGEIAVVTGSVEVTEETGRGAHRLRVRGSRHPT
jgi:hypothetical protein